MTVEVIIPKTNERVFYRHDDHIMLHEEVKQWLLDNCPSGQYRSSHWIAFAKEFNKIWSRYNDVWTDPSYVGEGWTFEDAQDAMLFKLTWA